jgi:hypothetical protein
MRYIFTQPGDIRLIYGGRQLNDDQSIGDYGIQSGNTVFMLLRLRGGSGQVPNRSGASACLEGGRNLPFFVTKFL